MHSGWHQADNNISNTFVKWFSFYIDGFNLMKMKINMVFGKNNKKIYILNIGRFIFLLSVGMYLYIYII